MPSIKTSNTNTKGNKQLLAKGEIIMNKNMKKILSMAVAASLISTISASVFANVVNHGPFNSEVREQREEKTLFQSFSGTIKEVVPFSEEDGKYFVLVEDKDGEQVKFYVSEDTYKVTDNKIEAGAEAVGFYDTQKPVVYSYPPQYTAVAFAVNLPKAQAVKVDRFDKNQLSFNKDLKLNVSDKTEVVLQNDEKFEGDLTDRKLLVVYSVVTNSMPAQTAPQKVVVLYEEVVAPSGVLPEIEEEADATDADGVWTLGETDNTAIMVNEKELTGAKTYSKPDGTLMLPVRAVSENLGFTVSWDSETNSVVLNNGISFTIGKDYYTYFRTAPIELGTAPELVDGTTYVPAAFFTRVAKAAEISVADGKVSINNVEAGFGSPITTAE